MLISFNSIKRYLYWGYPKCLFKAT